MLKIAAQQYIIIGEYLQEINRVLKDMGNAEEPVTGRNLNFLKSFLVKLKKECDSLQLNVPSRLISKSVDRLSALEGVNAHDERGRIAMLMEMIIEELKAQLFLYILPHRASYYQWDGSFSEQLITAFPTASKDLGHAGNCFASEEYTACVYHSMRALEIGLRSLCLYLELTFRKPIELTEWGTLIGDLEKKIEQMQNLPKTIERENELSFCSHALALFRHFKNAYRNPVSHARAYYEEDEAKSIMERTKEFLEGLSNKLSETP